MRKIILIGLALLLCLPIIPLNNTVTAVQDTVTIQPSSTYELVYDDLNVSDKLIWIWSVDAHEVDFWLEGPGGGLGHFEIEDVDSSSGSYVVPLEGTWKLKWENTYQYDVSEDYAIELTYDITLEPRNFPPVAGIRADPETGTAPLTVKLNSTSGDPDGVIESWYWMIRPLGESRIIFQSDDENHTYTFADPGLYNVTLNVTDDRGANGTTNITIDVNAVPVAEGSADKIEVLIDEQISFTGGGTDDDGSIGAYHWDFGDGNESAIQNPTHSYERPGTYVVMLNVTDDDGANGTDTLTITVSENPSLNRITIVILINGLKVDFNLASLDLLYQFPTSVSWNFGEGLPQEGVGDTFTAQHTFSKAGIYFVETTLTFANGYSAKINITVTATETGYNYVFLRMGPYRWADGSPIVGARVVLTGGTRVVHDAITDENGVAIFTEPVEFEDYTYEVMKTENNKTVTIMQGSITVDVNTSNNETWLPPEEEDKAMVPFTEEEFDDIAGISVTPADIKPPEKKEEKFLENTTKEVKVGDKEVEVTVTKSDEGEVTATIENKKDLKLTKDEPVMIDTDNDGEDDLKVIYKGEDENGIPIIEFEDVQYDKKAKDDSDYTLIIVISVIVVLVVLVMIIILVKKKPEEEEDEYYGDETSAATKKEEIEGVEVKDLETVEEVAEEKDELADLGGETEEEAVTEEIEQFACPECNSVVAETDASCPGCGVEFGEEEEEMIEEELEDIDELEVTTETVEIVEEELEEIGDEQDEAEEVVEVLEETEEIFEEELVQLEAASEEVEESTELVELVEEDVVEVEDETADQEETVEIVNEFSDLDEVDGELDDMEELFEDLFDD